MHSPLPLQDATPRSVSITAITTPSQYTGNAPPNAVAGPLRQRGVDVAAKLPPPEALRGGMALEGIVALLRRITEAVGNLTGQENGGGAGQQI